LSNKKLMEPRRFIFLDIDGVLNHESWYEYLHDNYTLEALRNMDFDEYNISPISTQLLNQLQCCEVVISSSWFYEEKTVRGLNAAGLKLPIIGGTIHKSLHDKSLCRGNDIARWFMENLDVEPPMDSYIERHGDTKWFHTKCHYDFVNGVEKFIQEKGDTPYTYVIFDDYNDMLFQQQNHFVHVDSQVGLTQSDIDKAKKILNL